MSIPHIESKEIHQMARESGQHGGAWIAFANRAGIDRVTADKYYRNSWLDGKDDEVMKWGAHYIKLMEEGINDAETIDEKMKVAKTIDNYLSKRSSDWSIKQEIEQTNLNIEAPKTDLSKLSEEEEETLKELILKSAG